MKRSDLSSIDIAQLAKRWQMSPRTLRQQLHAEGTSVTAVLNRIRFERARDLLQRGHSSISAVATMMGYSDPSAFHRAFKRWSGLAVNEFRARAVTDSE